MKRATGLEPLAPAEQQELTAATGARQRELADRQRAYWRAEQRMGWGDTFALYNERYATEAIAPIQNKVGTLLSPPAIRR